MMRGLRERIPNWVLLSADEASRLQTVASTDQEFVAISINAASTSARVESALGKTKDVLEQESVEAQKWINAENEVRALLRGLVSANLMRRHRVGLAALQTYAISRQLVREEENSALRQHVDAMKRIRRIGKRKPSLRTPAQQPVSHSTMQ